MDFFASILKVVIFASKMYFFCSLQTFLGYFLSKGNTALQIQSAYRNETCIFCFDSICNDFFFR